MAYNDSSAIGAAVAAKAAGLDDVVIVGENGDDDGIAAVKDGHIDATVDLVPWRTGLVVQTIGRALLEGKEVPTYVETTSVLYTKDTLGDRVGWDDATSQIADGSLTCADAGCPKMSPRCWSDRTLGPADVPPRVPKVVAAPTTSRHSLGDLTIPDPSAAQTVEETSMEPPVLQMRGVHKHFGRTHALKGVDFELRAGEAHALLGENGSGKSTLMKVAYGEVTPSSGEMLLRGETVSSATRCRHHGRESRWSRGGARGREPDCGGKHRARTAAWPGPPGRLARRAPGGVRGPRRAGLGHPGRPVRGVAGAR